MMMPLPRFVLPAFFLLVLCAAFAPAQGPAARGEAAWLLPVPELQPDPKIPTLAQIVGHAWGREISSHGEIERYLHALSKAAPERCKLVHYGRTNQGRNLYYLVISSAKNMKRLDEHAANNRALADARNTSPQRAKDLAAAAPAFVWFAYCVHGNETSPSDAALLTAYHLLADTRPQTAELLDHLVVILDPLQNPDGRDRFVQFHRETRGAFDQEHPLAADRQERWPGGRFNHYLFDMNRDWYLQTQRESQARVKAYLEWKPQIFVDAHEMGPDSTYFFDPSTEPYNPHTLARQKEWHLKIGRHHAARFDEHGFAYSTREMFDAFGPQYGSTWPTLHGAIGILWEQAGVRGRVIARKDQTKLYYHDGVRHHYVSGLATLEAAAKGRQQLLLDFYANSADSVRLGDSGPVRAFFLLEGKRPRRAEHLAALLRRNGIEVQRTTAAGVVQAADIVEGKSREHAIPAGSYFIPLDQPASRLALTLLERHQDMGAAYIKRQEDRVGRGLPDEIYDATAWSLPLAFDVPCLAATSSVALSSEPFASGPKPGDVLGRRAKLGYMLSGADDGVLPTLCQWLGEGLRVRVLSEATKVAGHDFPRGSLLVRVAENPERVHDAVAAAAQKHGVVVHAVESAFVEEGASLGGPNVRWVKPPRVLLMTERPAQYSVGHTWYLFDQVWRYPVTRIAGNKLVETDWSKFDVCILPHGKYTDAEAPNEDTVRRLREWVNGGGTLVLVGGAAAWATGDKVKLLASKIEQRRTDAGPVTPAADKKDEREKEEKRLPLAVPGVFLRADVRGDHFVTWGLGPKAHVFYSGDLIFQPLKEPADGKNLVVMTGQRDNLLVSGYCWPQTLDLLPGKPYALAQKLGKGHVIAFADDPNYRAFSPHLQRLFFNAVFFGPAQSGAE
jgi:putative intracellular protease/amidase